MIGEVELPAFCCVAGGDLADNQHKSKRLVVYFIFESFKILLEKSFETLNDNKRVDLEILYHFMKNI